MYFKSLVKRIIKTIILLPKRTAALFSYVYQWMKFKRSGDNRFSVRFMDLHPCLSDRISTTPFDQHYTYHPAWAARVLAKTLPREHIDISSILSFSAICSAFLPIKFYDYRPAHLQLSNFGSDFADLKNLPFQDSSIESLSCMHTIEHIGLGRYGDELDPTGDLRAITEINRVVKAGGNIMFVTPVGRPKIEFNAHRIYSFEQIVSYFSDCELVEFSLIPDSGGLITNADPMLVKDQKYGCGCFWFKKKAI